MGPRRFDCYQRAARKPLHVPERWAREWFFELDVDEALARIRCNFTAHDRLAGLSDLPFVLEV